MRQTKSASQTDTFVSQSSIFSSAHSTFRADSKDKISPVQQTFLKKNQHKLNVHQPVLERQKNFKYKTKGEMVKETRKKKQLEDMTFQELKKEFRRGENNFNLYHFLSTFIFEFFCWDCIFLTRNRYCCN